MIMTRPCRFIVCDIVYLYIFIVCDIVYLYRFIICDMVYLYRLIACDIEYLGDICFVSFTGATIH